MNFKVEQFTGPITEIDSYLEKELNRLLVERDKARPMLYLATTHREPSRPRRGMVVLADGFDWNPGSGRGFYGYYNGAWTFLG